MIRQPSLLREGAGLLDRWPPLGWALPRARSACLNPSSLPRPSSQQRPSDWVAAGRRPTAHLRCARGCLPAASGPCTRARCRAQSPVRARGAGLRQRGYFVEDLRGRRRRRLVPVGAGVARRLHRGSLEQRWDRDRAVRLLVRRGRWRGMRGQRRKAPVRARAQCRLPTSGRRTYAPP